MSYMNIKLLSNHAFLWHRVIEAYRRLTDGSASLLRALAQGGKEADFHFEPPRLEVLLCSVDLVAWAG